jgi:hypothetical protein
MLLLENPICTSFISMSCEGAIASEHYLDITTRFCAPMKRLLGLDADAFDVEVAIALLDQAHRPPPAANVGDWLISIHGIPLAVRGWMSHTPQRSPHHPSSSSPVVMVYPPH